MRISDWSSDVCSSDLSAAVQLELISRAGHDGAARAVPAIAAIQARADVGLVQQIVHIQRIAPRRCFVGQQGVDQRDAGRTRSGAVLETTQPADTGAD